MNEYLLSGEEALLFYMRGSSSKLAPREKETNRYVTSAIFCHAFGYLRQISDLKV